MLNKISQTQDKYQPLVFLNLGIIDSIWIHRIRRHGKGESRLSGLGKMNVINRKEE